MSPGHHQQGFWVLLRQQDESFGKIAHVIGSQTGVQRDGGIFRKAESAPHGLFRQWGDQIRVRTDRKKMDRNIKALGAAVPQRSVDDRESMRSPPDSFLQEVIDAA